MGASLRIYNAVAVFRFHHVFLNSVGAHPCVRPQKSTNVARAHTRVRPYGVKVRFGYFARLQVRRTVWINRIFQCDRRGDPRGLPFAAERQNDRGKPCHYNVKERLSFAERLSFTV